MLFDIIESMSHKLAVITVVYQNYELLNDFLKSLEKQSNKNFHLFIADLSEKKQSFDFALDKQLTIINDNNLGYAHGINQGLKMAIKSGYQYFCVVNNDIYFKENFVSSVLAAIINHKSSIIGGKVYYAPNYEYHNHRYQKSQRGHVLWYAGGNIDWDNLIISHRGVDKVDQEQYDTLQETNFITGCLMAFDKKVIDQVGFLDESYFLYYEDADFCQRAIRKNVKLFYDPSVVIWHKNAQSTGGSGSTIHQRYQEKNRLLFGLKYAPFRTKIHLIKNYLFKKNA